MNPFRKNDKQESDLEFFTIFDTKTNSYREPTHAKNKLDLIRALTNLFTKQSERENNPLFLNAEDFSIYKIGSYDKSTGLITSQNLEHVVNLHEIRSMIQQQEQSS